MHMTPIPASSTAIERWGKPPAGWRLKLYNVVFESDTLAGRRFDTWLIVLILLSLVVVAADSVEPLHRQHGALFTVFEWMFTLVFTLEYVTRLICVRYPWRYATSFFGIVDLLAILPTYLAGPEIRRGRLQTILDDYEPLTGFGRQLYACYTPSRVRLPKVRVFLEELERQFTPLPPWENFRSAKQSP